MWNKLREQRGAAVTLTALMLTVLVGLTAIVADLGMLFVNRSRLTNLADAAALAGAQELPYRQDTAVSTARSYGAQNGSAGDSLTVLVGDSGGSLTVNAVRDVPLFFAKIFNLNMSKVGASAQALNQVVSGMSGIVPLGIVKQQFIYGDLYTLKEGGGGGYSGNYGVLALGGTGATVYSDNLTYGYNGKLSIGQWISTETGNMSTTTKKGINYRIDLDPNTTYATVKKGSPRIVVVPVIDNLTVNGRSDVQIVGFAAFFLEGVGGGGKDNYVQGRFLRINVTGDVDTSTAAADYGVRNIRLVQ